MGKTIGAASDFYRLRVLRVDETGDVDLEWRDDILYRRPPATEPADDRYYAVEAVLLDDDDVTVTLGTFGDADEAYAWLEELTVALDEMTKSEFEDCYFPE